VENFCEQWEFVFKEFLSPPFLSFLPPYIKAPRIRCLSFFFSQKDGQSSCRFAAWCLLVLLFWTSVDRLGVRGPFFPSFLSSPPFYDTHQRSTPSFALTRRRASISPSFSFLLMSSAKSKSGEAPIFLSFSSPGGGDCLKTFSFFFKSARGFNRRYSSRSLAVELGLSPIFLFFPLLDPRGRFPRYKALGLLPHFSFSPFLSLQIEGKILSPPFFFFFARPSAAAPLLFINSSPFFLAPSPAGGGIHVYSFFSFLEIAQAFPFFEESDLSSSR